LVKIKAASVNSWDWDLLTGRPYIYRLMFGLMKPKFPVIGSDIAGVVVEIGKDVTLFKPGDEVFGDISGIGFGAFAEYACVPENLLAAKPARMSFEEAAAVPQAGVLALQGLRKGGEIKPGQHILLNGAGGGVGTFAIQIAKQKGAEVTCVDKGEKLQLLSELGADHVVDYSKADFLSGKSQYDLVVDVVARRSVYDYYHILNPGGHYVIVGGSISTIFQNWTLCTWMNRMKGKEISLLLHKPGREDLNLLGKMWEDGFLKPVVEKIYPLSQTAEAVQRIGEGKAMGKLVIVM